MDFGEVKWLILCCFGGLQTDWQTDERTDICTSRVAFATEKHAGKKLGMIEAKNCNQKHSIVDDVISCEQAHELGPNS